MRGMKKALFETFFEHHRDRIFGYTFYFLRNREDAEDVTQEVFAKLWQHWARINGRGRLAFTTRIAHNQCIDAVRRRKTSGAHARVSERLDLESMPARRDSNVDPELHMEFTEKQKAILAALEELPEKTRGILLMHYFQGLKLETIGEILGVKAATVRVTIHRGRALLRQALARKLPEGDRTYSDERALQ